MFTAKGPLIRLLVTAAQIKGVVGANAGIWGYVKVVKDI